MTIAFKQAGDTVLLLGDKKGAEGWLGQSLYLREVVGEEKGAPPSMNWWEEPHKRRLLIDIATRESAAFVYDTAALDEAIAAVQGVKSVDNRLAVSSKSS